MLTEEDKENMNKITNLLTNNKTLKCLWIELYLPLPILEEFAFALSKNSTIDTLSLKLNVNISPELIHSAIGNRKSVRLILQEIDAPWLPALEQAIHDNSKLRRLSLKNTVGSTFDLISMFARYFEKRRPLQEIELEYFAIFSESILIFLQNLKKQIDLQSLYMLDRHLKLRNLNVAPIFKEIYANIYNNVA